MINPSYPLASWFLLISAISFGLVYALPLLFVPLRWARVFLWEVPEKTDLTVYFARCTGCLAVVICVLTIESAPDPKGHLMVFELIACVCIVMTLLHIWGLIRRVQPWTEHLEIVLYGVEAGLAIWIRSMLT